MKENSDLEKILVSLVQAYFKFQLNFPHVLPFFTDE